MSQVHDFTIRFWGVRGSYPTPGATTVRYGGNTACVEVAVNGVTIILDCGTGLIGMGRSLIRRPRPQGTAIEAYIFLSHLHHDHTQGFPFFAPGFVPSAHIHLMGPNFADSDPQLTMSQVMQPPYFPVRLNELTADMDYQALRGGEVVAINPNGGAFICRPGDALAANPELVKVRVMRSYAHPGGVMHYRIEWRERSVVYATDTEGYVNGDQRLAAFARNTDLLIHDAQYTDEHYLGLMPGIAITQGYGHSTVKMACQMALAAEVKQLALFHHAPEYGDERLDQVGAEARQVFPNLVVAAEGQEIHLDTSDVPAENQNADLLAG